LAEVTNPVKLALADSKESACLKRAVSVEASFQPDLAVVEPSVFECVVQPTGVSAQSNEPLCFIEEGFRAIPG